MTRKILWVLLSFLLAASLVLASCAKEEVVTPGEEEEVTPGEEEEAAPGEAAPGGEEEVVVPEVGEPQYGGTFTFLHAWKTWTADSFDVFYSPSGSMQNVLAMPFLERLLTGDIEKYGPRGTNEYAFQVMEYVPEKYLTGQLAESWEVTTAPLGVTFYLKHGIMWTGNANIGMEPREFTADDVVFHFNGMRASPRARGNIRYVDSVTAIDRYTVRFEFNTFNAMWLERLGYWGGATGIQPHEVVEAGANDWRNQTGTGPFIMTGNTFCSFITYERNPNYWGKTTINGKEYQMPFIDKLIFPSIPDQSTQVAALRTGVLDWWPETPLVYEGSLAQTCPEMIQQKLLGYANALVMINTVASGSKWSDVNLRRAMMIATDLKAIRDTVFISGDLDGLPVARGCPEYTPLEELPEHTRMLYDYNPTLAKQMIVDAGYPNGFKCEVMLPGDGDELVQLDIASMLVNMWAKVGVQLGIKVMERTAVSAATSALSYPDFVIRTGQGAVSNNELVYGVSASAGGRVGATCNDPKFDEMYWDAYGTVDPVERTAKLKALCVYFTDNVMLLGFGDQDVLNCYWPWVKNYFNEKETGYRNQMGMISRIWLDQDLKKTMGF